MLRKLLQGAIVTILIVIIPTIGNLAILHAPHIWILIVIGILASFFQPKYNPFKHAPDKNDKGTANQIIWSIYLTQLFMLVEATYFRCPGSITWNSLTTIALVLMVTGLAIRTWAVITLGSLFTWHITAQNSQDVITTGPYAFVRHPGYFGAFITYCSTTVFLHSWVACIVTAVFLSFAFLRRIHHEEKVLISTLGPKYEDYCRSVKRFIPLVW
jgi:protein-S-isoprenylcysteine O-methyltransferase